MFWSSFHPRLIVAIADTIAPLLRPKYYVEVEARTYLDEADEDVLVGIPDALILSIERSQSLTPPNAQLVAFTHNRYTHSSLRQHNY